MNDKIIVTVDIEGTKFGAEFDPNRWAGDSDGVEYMSEHIGGLITRTIQQHYNSNQVLPASMEREGVLGP